MAAILADDIFKCIFLNENDRIPIQISLKLVPMSPVDNKPVLVQVMAWRHQTSNITCTLVGNKIVDHSDVGTAPTTSSPLST